MKVLQRMRQAVREENYRLSSHANDEMGEDFLEAADIENIILGGKVVRKFTHDPRGIRYEVMGQTKDANYQLGVTLKKVCHQDAKTGSFTKILAFISSNFFYFFVLP